MRVGAGQAHRSPATVRRAAGAPIIGARALRAPRSLTHESTLSTHTHTLSKPAAATTPHPRIFRFTHTNSRTLTRAHGLTHCSRHSLMDPHMRRRPGSKRRRGANAASTDNAPVYLARSGLRTLRTSGQGAGMAGGDLSEGAAPATQRDKRFAWPATSRDAGSMKTPGKATRRQGRRVSGRRGLLEELVAAPPAWDWLINIRLWPAVRSRGIRTGHT